MDSEVQGKQKFSGVVDSVRNNIGLVSSASQDLLTNQQQFQLSLPLYTLASHLVSFVLCNCFHLSLSLNGNEGYVTSEFIFDED